MIKSKMDGKNFFIAVLISFVAVQIGSYVLSELGFMPFIKMGFIIFLFMIIIVLTTLFTLGKNINQLNLKKDGPFILLIFGTIILMFIFLPDIVPQIFSSYSIQISDFIKETMISIIKLDPLKMVG